MKAGTVHISEPQREKESFGKATGKLVVKRSVPRKKSRSQSIKRVDEGPRSRFLEVLPPDQEQVLRRVVKRLVEPGKGVLDIGSSAHLSKRFTDSLLDYDEESKLQYLGLYLGAGGRRLSQYVSGLLVGAGLLQVDNVADRKFVYAIKALGLKLGVNIGGGSVSLAGTLEEPTTEGLDDIQGACARARDLGAEFTCWRTVHKTSDFNPSYLGLKESSNTLARFAVSSQREGLVPLVSVLIEHQPELGLDNAQTITEEALSALIKALIDHHVYLEGTIIETTLVGFDPTNPHREEMSKVATATLIAWNRSLPPAIGGVMLANHSPLADVADALNKVNSIPGKRPYPISFCFGHVMHEGVVEKWAGNSKNVNSVQDFLVQRANLCSAGTMGQIPTNETCLFITLFSTS